MKYIRFTFFSLCSLVFLHACDFDEDICTEPGTPRMKVKFKDESGPISVDALSIDVDFGDKVENIADGKMRLDSIMIPLRVDHSGYTKISLMDGKTGRKTDVIIKYEEKSEFISPGCGVRKLYEKISCSSPQPGEGVRVEINETEIKDEDKTVLYFVF